MAVPFVVVLVISMLKDAYEDYKRYREDEVGNNQLTDIFD
jgi:hypothetical protein